MVQIIRRPFRTAPQQFSPDWHPVVRDIYAARVGSAAEVEKKLQLLQSPQALPDIALAAETLARAIRDGEDILIYGDYDVDGASATALMMRVLRKLGARVRYFVPNRMAHGYGLSPAGLAACSPLPDVLVTVDNGTRSHEAAADLLAQGVKLIITDHHEPDAQLPPAVAVVNPKRHDSRFASPHLAGVGVVFYLLLALRRHYVEQGWDFACQLTDYLDLVALGTVADIVPLDFNNRILVQAGMQRLQSAKGNLGLRALCAVANLNPAVLLPSDIGFALAPRLNAVGRLEDMHDGVELLLCDDWATAGDYAEQLDLLNRDRKALESEMCSRAMQVIDEKQAIASAYLPDAHEGVIGIVAARIKSRFARPALVATDAQESGKIKASLRSVQGVNIHELLALAAQSLPPQVLQFGGHALAAGLTVQQEYYAALIEALNAAFYQHIGLQAPEAAIYVDGELPPDMLHIDWARYLEKLEPWGSELPAPQFYNRFQVIECRQLGAQHTRMNLRHLQTGQQIAATWFFQVADFRYGDTIGAVFQMQVNRFFGDERLNLLISHAALA